MPAKALESAGFCAPTGEYIEGLVPVRQSLNHLSADEAAVVRQAVAFEFVDYVFFRRFEDHRSSNVCAYIVDNEMHNLRNDQLAELHSSLWLHGVAPIVYVSSDTRIDILSCARGPDFWNEASEEKEFSPAVKIQLASKVEGELRKLKRFHAIRLCDGTFWHDPQNKRLSNHKKAAHETLIQAIVDVDQKLDGKNNPVMRRLLLLMVLIKYLEDRNVFPKPNWFGHYCSGATSFLDVLRNGTTKNVLSVLRKLQKKFNGDVFGLPEDIGSHLTDDLLRQFAEMVDTTTIKRQRYLWEQYSFEHIPVEIISHLYNRFLTGKNQVYTPPFLAELILDYSMPYKRLGGNERILDPACGSGVFLVGAFRRLVNIWRKKNKWRDPSVAKLKSILNNSIFGVEHHPTAVDLTAFSLALAVCDALKPNVIWSELQFDQLRTQNVYESDFFDCIPENQNAEENRSALNLGTFDVIIGNPPFESELSKSAGNLNKKLEKLRGKLPDTQIAYFFLEQSIGLLKNNGILCLLQPHGFLYNQNTFGFRNHVLSSCYFEAVLDFVSIRHLFDGADPKSLAILVSKKSHQQDRDIVHRTFRRTFLAHQRLGFELDHYDTHFVPPAVAKADPLVWRTNLFGGGRISCFYQRIKQIRTLREFAESRDWLMSEGFIVGKNPKKQKKAEFLTGMKYLPTIALGGTGIEKDKLETVEETHFHTAYTKQLYESPMLLIKENENLHFDYWNEGDLAFNQKVVAVSANADEAETLLDVFEFIKNNHDFCRFVCILVSSENLLARQSGLAKADIDRIPYPVDAKTASLAFWEKVIQSDTLDYFSEFIKKGQNSALLRETADQRSLSLYAKMFTKMLESVFENLAISNPIFFDAFICQPFYFGDAPEINWMWGGKEEENLRDLVFGEYGNVIRTNRIVRLYDQNVILIVKPDRLRYWIQSTAIRDADDTLIDLKEQGY